MSRSILGPRFRKTLAVVACTSMSLAGVVASASHVSADTVSSTFETLTPGTVNGQDGWTSLGAAGSGCAVYDHAVVNNVGAPVSFGAKSLRISDAVTSGCFSDQTFSKKTTDEAGEPTADAGIYASGTRRNHFVGSFDFASVLPGSEQTGLHMSLAPDRGDGARMSYLRIEDSPGGWNIFFDDYIDNAPLGSGGNLDNGCGPEDVFTDTLIQSGVSRGAHNLRFDETFVPGPHNDVVKIYLDNVLIHTGTSWEDYYRYCGESGGGTAGTLPDKSRTVRSLLFRTSGTADPGNAGNGFLIDNVSSTTNDVLPSPPTINTVTSAGPSSVSVAFTPGPDNGSPITSYTATCVSLAGQANGTTTGAGSPLVVGGLAQGTPYVCTVTETSLLGTSPPSAPSNVIWPGTSGGGGGGGCTTPLSAPIQPSSAPGNASATVSWGPPATGCFEGYVVHPFIGTAAQTPQLVSGKGTTTVVKGLINGQKYTFTIAAYNGNVEGPASVATTPITVGVPAASGAAKVTRIASRVLKVSFTAPANNGAPITRYTATCSSSNGGVTKAKAGKASPILVGGLSAGKTYTCSVTATNSRGTGRASRASSPAKA